MKTEIFNWYLSEIKTLEDKHEDDLLPWELERLRQFAIEIEIERLKRGDL